MKALKLSGLPEDKTPRWAFEKDGVLYIVLGRRFVQCVGSCCMPPEDLKGFNLEAE